MEIKIESYQEREEVQAMYVSVVKYNNKEYTLASYVYDGELKDDETAPSFWNTDEFNKLDAEVQESIINLVNVKIISII